MKWDDIITDFIRIDDGDIMCRRISAPRHEGPKDFRIHLNFYEEESCDVVQPKEPVFYMSNLERTPLHMRKIKKVKRVRHKPKK